MQKKHFIHYVSLVFVLLLTLLVLTSTKKVHAFETEVYGTKEISCAHHPIYCQIKSNRPELNDDYAMNLSNLISKKAQKYNVDAQVLTAILAHESGYDGKARNCQKGFDAKELEKGNLKIVKICTDFGIGEIHYRQIINRQLDLFRIMEDLDYAVDVAAQMMSEFEKDYSHREEDYWTRYNSQDTVMREVYKRLVEKYL